jgi:membrane-bound lytic murein transglycosylase D
LGGSFASLLFVFAGQARADDPVAGATDGARGEPPHASTWSQEALEGVEQVSESPELRTLRLAEEQLFADDAAELPDGFDPDGAPSSSAATGGKDAVTDAPPLSFERNGETVDLSFLKGLKLPSTPVHWDRRVVEYLLFFKDDPRGRDLASAWLKRRERFGPMVRRILGEHSLPTDLQYVAMIESGYDPLAHSAAEAWGMWQFVKEPASYYGLRIDHWTDERLDPERSTRAASRFMRDLYERFGSWELTFASYNMGYGGLLRAIKKYNTNDYWLLSHLEAGLPFETSLYVAKISAMAIVANNPERFGFTKLTPEPPQQLAKVDVAAGTRLSDIASAAGVSLEQLRAVNPHLKQGRVPPAEPAVNVYVPREGQVRFAQNWSQRREAAPLPLPHVMRLGETLEQLAKRADTTPQKLRELNELAPDAPVRAGFALFVPAHAKPTKDLVEPLIASVPARDFQYTQRKRIFYRVGPDDTTAAVARFFDVSPDELITWNSLAEGAALHMGMLLQLYVQPDTDLSQAVVYMPDEVRILTVGSNEFFDYHEAQRGRVRVRYRVQAGDTMSSLAARFDLSTGSIGRINQFPSNRELKRGEQVVVYVPDAELVALEEKGLVERFSADTSAPALGDTRATELATSAGHEGEPDFVGLDTKTPELPEAEGRRPAPTRAEAPLVPPKKKTPVAAPVRAIEKAAKAPKAAEKKRP